MFWCIDMKWYYWVIVSILIFPSIILISAYGYGLPKGTFVSKNFTINNMTAIPQSHGDKFDVLGILTYRGNATVSFTKVIVEVYNSSLRPGDSTPFRVNTNVSQPAFDHYVVKVGVTTDSNRLSNLFPMSKLQPETNPDNSTNL